jgi:SET domain-containing protein
VQKGGRGKRSKTQTAPSNVQKDKYTLRIQKQDTDQSGQTVVKKSSIPKAGWGLFAAMDIEEGMTIGLYKGTKLNKKSMELRCKNAKKPPRYIIKVFDDVYIDGAQGGNFTRRINAPSGGRVHNALFQGSFSGKRKMYVNASTNIKKGEEILVDYKDEYVLFSSDESSDGQYNKGKRARKQPLLSA